MIPDPIVTNAPFVNRSLVAGASIAGPALGERDALRPTEGLDPDIKLRVENILSAPRSVARQVGRA